MLRKQNNQSLANLNVFPKPCPNFQLLFDKLERHFIRSGSNLYSRREKTTREKLGLNQGPHALQVTTGPWPLENDNWAIASRVDKCRKLLEEEGCCNNNANNWILKGKDGLLFYLVPSKTKLPRCCRIILLVSNLEVCGPWWWSSGQRSCLLLRRSEFESRWLLNKFSVRKDENKKKRKRDRGWPILKKK